MRYNKIGYIFIVIIIILLVFLFRAKKVEGFENRYTAIIIEPRKHKALEYVLRNFLENLDNNWNFIIFHGTLNKEYIEDIINNKLQSYKYRIELINLNVDNLNTNEYNKILANKDIYAYIPTEIFLIFQTDALINPKYKDKINNFLEYDYVGAPWRDSNGEVGNGGLSLRKKSKMLEIINNCPYDNVTNEDIYFSARKCKDTIINKPEYEKAKEFASETIWNPTSFGIHKVWKYFNINDIHYEFPEIKELYDLQ